MSWMGGTDRAVCCHCHGSTAATPPSITPSRPRVTALRTVRPMTAAASESTAPAAPAYAAHRKIVKAVGSGHHPAR